MVGDKRVALILLLILCSLLVALPNTEIVRAVEDSWTTLEPMPTARSSFGVAVVDGKIYAIGGWNGSYLGTNEMYDPATDTWTTKKSMPTPRHGFGIAVYQNKIYAIGGITGPTDSENSGFTGLTEVYDPKTDAWKNKTSMPTARSSLSANVVDDKIYLIGGRKYSRGLSTVHYIDEKVNEVYDPKTDTWTTQTPMPEYALGYSSAVIENKIYIIGGLKLARMWTEGATLSLDNNQIYDPETDTWSSGKPIPTIIIARAAGATTGVLAPKRIYVVGGNYGLNIATNLTQVYDPVTDMWSTGTPMPTPRYGLGVAVVNDELYVIGGKTVDNYLAVNEKYTPLGYISEFPSWIILPLLLTVTLLIILCKRRLAKTTNN